MTTLLHSAQSPIEVTRQAAFDLPASEVWAIISDFAHMENWHPAVVATQMRSGTSGVPGAVRTLRFIDGGTLDEQLTAYAPQDMRIDYRIAAGAFPVSHYRSTLSVQAVGEGIAQVVWSGSFLRADTSPSPAVGRDDAAAIEAVTAVYDTGLQQIGRIVADRKAIHEVIGFYADGGTRGDAQTVSRAFHPSATMKFVRHGQLVDEPIEAFYKNYIKPGVLQNRTVTTDSIDLRGTAASARLTIDYPTHQFIDYFNLLKIDGQWRVVSKIFHRVDKPQP